MARRKGSGLGFRRSIKIGPFRINLSKSGVGASLGIPGFTVGAGPRGPYLRAGIPGTGIYYRESLKRPYKRPPSKRAQKGRWLAAVRALIEGQPQRALELLDGLRPGAKGPAVHVDIGGGRVVTIVPDEVGISLVKHEALLRLGRTKEAHELAFRTSLEHMEEVARLLGEKLPQQAAAPPAGS